MTNKKIKNKMIKVKFKKIYKMIINKKIHMNKMEN